MLLGRKTGAFHEVEDRHRGVAKLLAGSPGGLYILPLQLRAVGDLLLGMAVHKGKIQRPPGNPE